MYEVILSHGRTTGSGPVDAAPDMKKDCAAVSRHRRIGVMPYLHQPSIGKIVMPHFLFFEPRRRINRIVDRNESIVIGAVHVIDPRVGWRNLMKRKISSGR